MVQFSLDNEYSLNLWKGIEIPYWVALDCLQVYDKLLKDCFNAAVLNGRKEIADMIDSQIKLSEIYLWQVEHYGPVMWKHWDIADLPPPFQVCNSLAEVREYAAAFRDCLAEGRDFPPRELFVQVPTHSGIGE